MKFNFRFTIDTENHELPPRIYREEEQHSKISIQQSQPIPIVAPSGKQPMPCMCPYCHFSIVSRVEKSNGLVVWLASAGICLLGCAVGCCLIPFFIDDLKDTTHYCPNCNRVIGRDKKL
ncbi:unnamed protein product [Adineta steineri]|uniref:LITAF domain-containing protein n=1 Tax=Adineta steineri TaxID=433720 RepID=A0A815LGS6_9BILA|nr:unnamed protein product [Adineta steineri]